MPEKLVPLLEPNSNPQVHQGDALRILSRSPHPYRRTQSELPHSSYKAGHIPSNRPSPLRLSQNTDDEASVGGTPRPFAGVISERSTDSDSGTEADDEHFLKGLPAPKLRPHKGLRGAGGALSGTPSPLLSPAILPDDVKKDSGYARKAAPVLQPVLDNDALRAAEKAQRKKRAEIVRRVVETLLLVGVGEVVRASNEGLTAAIWNRELLCQKIIFGSIMTLYPLRLLYHRVSFTMLASCDPAPLLYPAMLPPLVSTLLYSGNSAAFLPNLILSNSSLPSELIPSLANGEDVSILHWMISLIPLVAWNTRQEIPTSKTLLPDQNLDPEILSMLFPLHQALCVTLNYLTTTSLLAAELQLLSVALINLLLLSSSPQAIILKSLLWIGGLGLLMFCSRVLGWVVALARVPKWRFRKAENPRRNRASSVQNSRDMFSFGKLRGTKSYEDNAIGESEDDLLPIKVPRRLTNLRLDIRMLNGSSSQRKDGSLSAVEPNAQDFKNFKDDFANGPDLNKHRRHTFSDMAQPSRSSKRTPGGRRKRAVSSSIQSFFSLTERQAAIRKWLYAGYVYMCVVLIILVGIRSYVGHYALGGNEPIGWALGYLFGNISWFRMQVMMMGLDWWICLPERAASESKEFCHLGWVEHLRQSTFGPGNIRLILFSYWLGIITVGLAVVFRLSAIYEVDTRRKVFHFMMVGVLLPSTYIDPTFAGLALSLVLAVFLLLDLFRASQLPPLSKPLAYFLTPYVDGRDLRGPVVISHIFLLIGCAIPLWLSLASLSRTGSGLAAGWEVPTRDVSMVSGVICVGMGDAAASLIGRRYGRHKWLWMGGKSIEGSLAFATAVGVALMFAKAWLRLGGWVDGGGSDDAWVTTALKVGTAATIASLTEAVLTGGNDNVVVPVVLWLCVKGLGI